MVSPAPLSVRGHTHQERIRTPGPNLVIIPLVMPRAPLGTPPRSLQQPTSGLAMCLCLAVAFLEKTAICPRVLVLTNYATSNKFRAAKPGK